MVAVAVLLKVAGLAHTLGEGWHAGGNGAGPQQLAVWRPAVVQVYGSNVSTGASHRHAGDSWTTGQTNVLQSQDAVGHGKLCAPSKVCAIRLARSGS
eukprot:scaffold54145_cov85-Phaeocystis_antarctica.AAC.2